MKKQLISFIIVCALVLTMFPIIPVWNEVYATDDPTTRSEKSDYFTLTATGGSVTVQLVNQGSAPDVYLEYITCSATSTDLPDATWNEFVSGSATTMVTLAGGESIILRAPEGMTNAAFNTALAESTGWWFTFGGRGYYCCKWRYHVSS